MSAITFRGIATVSIGGLALPVQYEAAGDCYGRALELRSASLVADAGYTVAVIMFPEPDALMRDHAFWSQVYREAQAALADRADAQAEQYDDPVPRSGDDEHRIADDLARARDVRRD
jgi:hypothetical protein